MLRYNLRSSHIGMSALIVVVLVWSITHALAQTITVTGTGLQGYINQAYNAQFSSSGGSGSYTYALTSGTIPNGTIFVSSNGQIIGTPTQTGQFNITVVSTDSTSATSAATSFTLCIGIGFTPATATLPSITATKAYSATVSAVCGADTNSDNVRSYTFGATGLPTGLSINPTSGIISGTTTFVGTSTVTVTATDEAGQTGSITYTVSSANPVFSYAPASLANGVTGQAYSTTITISNGTAPYTITQQGSSVLPAGYTFSQTGNSSFRLSGTTTATGVYHLDVKVVDTNGVTENKVFSFSVTAPALDITPSTLSNATVGVAFSQQLAATGGNGTYTFSLASGSSLPANISLTQSGLLDGIPKTAGTYIFTVNVEDTSTPKRTGTRVFTLLVVGGSTPAYGSSPNPGGIISFGLVTTPGTDVVQSLTITNTGTATLSVTVPSTGVFTGTSASDFRFGGTVTPPFSVVAGGNVVVLVICRPSNTLFPSTATMTLLTNDPVRPTVTYSLLCNQVTPTSTPGVGTPTAVAGTAVPSVLVLGRATAIVTESPDTFATVTFVKGLALRSGPYLGASMLGVIRPKKDYAVLAMNPGDGGGDFNWYLLVDVDNNRIGWASGRYLILKGDPNIPLNQTVFDQIDTARDVGARVTIFGNVNIRARPSERMPVIHTTAYGTELEVIGRTIQAGVIQWLQVRFYDTSGRPIVGWIYYKFDAPELIKLTGIAPLDAVPIR